MDKLWKSGVKHEMYEKLQKLNRNHLLADFIWVKITNEICDLYRKDIIIPACK